MVRPAVGLVALLIAVILAGCAPDDLSFGVDDLPPGDSARGTDLFRESVNGAPACAGCHPTDQGQGTGPSLAGYGARAGDQVKGQSAEEYTFLSMLRPSKHMVRGFSNVMYDTYEDKLSRQDIADLIAYLLSL